MSGLIHTIDWTDQIEELAPFLLDRGGYIRVHHNGNRCAPRAFAKTVSGLFENRGPNSRSTRLDAEVFTTRYLHDVLETLASKIGMTLEAPSAPFPPAANLEIGSGNRSKGNQNINISINPASEPYGSLALLDRRLGSFGTSLEAFLETGRLLVIVTSMEANTQDQFWSKIWKECLSRMTQRGLLVLKMHNSLEETARSYQDEGDPDLEIELPTSWNGHAKKQVISDLSDILVYHAKVERNFDLSKQEAENRVSGLVYSHWNDIGRLHDYWSGVLLQMIKDVG